MARTHTPSPLDQIQELHIWSQQYLASTIITVASGKGGVGKTTLAIELAYCLDAVLVDLDWDDGCASRALGWRHETRVRSPLLDALEGGRLPRMIRGKGTRPDFVPAGPDLEANQPRPHEMADALASWADQWERPIVVDTHPGGGPVPYGAMSASHAIAGLVQLGEKELDALDGWCGDLAGYPITLVPNRVPRVPPAQQLDRLEQIAGEYKLPVCSPVPDATWLPRRKARTALTSSSRVSRRSEPVVRAMATVSREVGEYAVG